MKLLTLAQDLQRRKARERQGLFVAEGIRTVEELLRSSFTIRGVIVSPALEATPRGVALRTRLAERRIETLEVPDRQIETVSDTEVPQGVLAIAVVPELKLWDAPNPDMLRLLVLDAVQDPGNVGTIIRTAAALGATATVSLPGTVDLWNAKVVRSGMGAHFHNPCISGTWDEFDAFRRRRGFSVWAADASGDVVDGLEAPARLALVVGNEGAGLSADARARADRLVALSIAPSVESLNVAVATGILLYELR
jgi:RNA methyltransferase, TrmH family